MGIDFGLYEVNVEEMFSRHQEVSYHIIFDVNIGENLLRKPLMVSGGHNTTTLWTA